LQVKEKELMRISKRLEEATERANQLQSLSDSKVARGRDR